MFIGLFPLAMNKKKKVDLSTTRVMANLVSEGSIRLGESLNQVVVYVNESLPCHSIASDVPNDFLFFISLSIFLFTCLSM